MIYEALTFIARELNEYLKVRFGITEDRVVVSNIVGQDGTPAIKDDNKLILSLINVQEEKMLHNNKANPGGNPLVAINLFVIFSTTFNGQLSKEALKYISVVIGFFQANKVFDSSDGLDAGIEKLIFEFYNLDFQLQNNLWAAIGAKYTPSVIYKVRMITVDEGMIDTDLTPSDSFPE